MESRRHSETDQVSPSHHRAAFETSGFELQSKIVKKLYSAFNEQSIDIGDSTELAKIASSEPELKLPLDEAKKFIESDKRLYELDKQLRKAHVWGIDQVPTYILDKTDAYREAITTEDWFKKFEVLGRAYGLK